MKELNQTSELLGKAKFCKNAEELIVLAKENNTELSADEAKAIYAKLHLKYNGEIADEELDNISGGGACEEALMGSKPPAPYSPPEKPVEYL